MTWYVILLAGLALLMAAEHVAKVLNGIYWRNRIKRRILEYEADYTAADGTCILCGEDQPHVCKARI